MRESDHEPMTFARALRSADFWLLLSGCVAALAGLSAWLIVPLLVAGLSIASLPKYLELLPRARAAGVEREWLAAVGLSTFNSLGAAAGAVVVGWVVRWLWW